MTRYSNLLPSASTLRILGYDVPEGYTGESILETTPLYLKSIKKIIDAVGLEEYNRLLIVAENKSVFDKESMWYSFEVLLNFYGFEKEIDKIKEHILEGRPNKRGYKDILYYFHLIGVEGMFTKINWQDAGYIIIVPDGIADPCIEILATLDSNFSTADLCYTLYVSNCTNSKFFRTIKDAGDVLHNGFLYEVIGTYCFVAQNVFREKSLKKGEKHPIVNSIINGRDAEILEYIFNHYNDNEFQMTNFTGENSKHENQMKRLEFLFESTVPHDQWIDYLQMPTDWVEKITSDR
jgi:hypothetical protein